MRKHLIPTAFAALIIVSSGASAATRQIDFSFGPLDRVGTSIPFGLALNDTVTGSFTFDDTGLTGFGNFDLASRMLGLSLTTGTKTWSLLDIVDNSFDFVQLGTSNQVLNWRFDLLSGDARSVAATNGTFSLNGTTQGEFIYCNDCASFAETPVSAEPLPASAGLALAGFASLLALGRGRRRAA